MEHNEIFTYTYSAKEQAEIQNIRKKYIAPEESADKMTQLRRLDAAVTSKATAAALVVGILGVLVLGTGMSLVMSPLGSYFGLTGSASMILGIVIGLSGIVMVCAAYPIYERVLKKERQKAAPEILRLTDELMK